MITSRRFASAMRFYWPHIPRLVCPQGSSLNVHRARRSSRRSSHRRRLWLRRPPPRTCSHRTTCAQSVRDGSSAICLCPPFARPREYVLGAVICTYDGGLYRDRLYVARGRGDQRSRRLGAGGQDQEQGSSERAGTAECCSRAATKASSSCASRSKTRRTSELASGAPLCAISCKSMSGMPRLRATASLDAPHSRALDTKMSRFPEFQRVFGNGLGTAERMPVDSAETNPRAALNFAMKRAR
jgi:hypothetical protein